MNATAHASIRSQQRGIPPLVVDLLLQFGCREHDHTGAEIVYFDRRSKKRLESYAVLADGEIVTVGARFKRINHH